MSDELLRHYEEELRFLRQQLGDYSGDNPKIGNRLRTSRDTVKDPHVERLMEGVAVLNARIRHRLDDQFPELTHGLLGMLQPHLLAPVPSMSVLHFQTKPDLGGAFDVPQQTMLDSEPVLLSSASKAPVKCRFQTVYPVKAWPLRVAEARLIPTPFPAPATTPLSRDAAAVLEIRIECVNPKMKLADLKPERLRFFLNLEPMHHAFALQELLLNDAVEVALASDAHDKAPHVLSPEVISPVGFEPDEGLLPYPPQTFLGYRLLTEFFVFPEKFLFFDIGSLPASKWAKLGREARLYVYLRRTNKDVEGVLEKDKQASSLMLNCTPVVNLFKHRVEPAELDRKASEQLLVPDSRRGPGFELFSIDKVAAITKGGKEYKCSPFFSIDRFGDSEESVAWWSVRRRLAAASGDGEEPTPDGPTDLWISFVDHGQWKDAGALTLEVMATACNRELPERLPFGNDRPSFAFVNGAGGIERVRCLRKPTPTQRRPADDKRLWELVSSLALHQVAIAGPQGTLALRELLRLHMVEGSNANRAAIDGLRSLEARKLALRINVDGNPGMAQGTEVRITLDRDKCRHKGTYLFAAVLERFLALYSQMNSFVQVVLLTPDREGEVKRWPARAGDRPLI